ncbi:hypothetical protein FGADI_4364 [Fusarium gaditjirri]|uniref:Uncharacterized protein n=1 Tax=Fusarium gaditjirri TaxID=282569 RepID=A0A8H4TD34_9HYPO|nr:hypothetical protein FGADI_4364 [Fusarium gaditjirri]
MAEHKPVVVIVPGGFCSPEVYQPVANILEQDGFIVIIPRLKVTKNLASKDPASQEFKDLANKGVLDDATEIHARLASEFDKGSEVVIFGHSYGSLPGLLAVERHTVQERQAKGLSGGIKAYIAVAGFPYTQRGKNALGNTDPAPPMPYHEHEDGIFHLTETAKPLFFSDLPPDKQDEAWELVLGSQSQKSLSDVSKFINSDVTIPKTYVLCEKDQTVPPELQEMLIHGGGFDKVEKLPSGHFPFLTNLLLWPNPKFTIYISALTALLTSVTTQKVSGPAQGFAQGVAGGGSAAAVTPKNIQELVTYLTDKTPRVIVLDGTYDFIGSEGTVKEKGYKTIIGVGNKGIIKGKGLRFVNVKNIIAQNIHITNLNPQYVWGGDAFTFSGTSKIWVDHCTTSLLGRQHYVFGRDKSTGITLSNIHR